MRECMKFLSGITLNDQFFKKILLDKHDLKEGRKEGRKEKRLCYRTDMGLIPGFFLLTNCMTFKKLHNFPLLKM